jgi:uncharacterized protein
VKRMLRDLLIERGLFEKIRLKALDMEEKVAVEEMDRFEKTVLKRLRKKRSVKKYKKMGVTRSDLMEIIELADITSLELFRGPSNSELAFEHKEWCNHCGRCCTESSPIFIHKDELTPILTFNPDLKDEIICNEYYPEHFRFKEDKPCKFHDSLANRCKIYDSRPQVCRYYPLMLVGTEENPHKTINLRHNCNYAISLVLEKSKILFDEAINRLD